MRRRAKRAVRRGRLVVVLASALAGIATAHAAGDAVPATTTVGPTPAASAPAAHDAQQRDPGAAKNGVLPPAPHVAAPGAAAGKPHARHAHAARGPHDATARHAFDDVAHWSRVFDDPAREAWQKPAELVAALEIPSGATVADVGAGTGYFSRHLATAVGANGTVLAADTEPALVEHLRERAQREGLANLVPILASTDDPRLPAGTADVVLIVDTWHHIDDRVAYARRLAGALAPGGRVVIVDWQKRELPVGPPLDHKLAREQVIDELTQAGYRLRAEPELLPYQYVLIFGR